MPAIMTHDFFGKDVYAANESLIGASHDERDAFLLGNQGPDPLFYLVISPRYKDYFALGSDMHHIAPSELLAALKESLCVLEPDERAIGRAYALGFLCHYTLDRAMHPFVYSQQFAICDAGVDGLDNSDGGEVHGEIEREFDEMALYTKLGCTIRAYKPYREVLHASDTVLDVVGKMYAFAAMRAYRMFPPRELFGQAVRNFRRIQHAFYSPGSAKAAAVDAVETRVLRRNHSLYKSMAHRDNPTLVSAFDNREHAEWENPFTHERSTASFWDIFEAAKPEAAANMRAFSDEAFDEKAARELTRGLDFSGEPVE